MLDRAYVETYGEPEVVKVPIGTDEGYGILVTGHSYKALYDLLRQIRELGLENEIRVYTHSEMTPAHSYPAMRGFTALYGNWGGSWVRQKSEFNEFPGVILGTSNCVQQPLPGYADRIYTTGIAGLEGVPHIDNDNYETLIKHALRTPKMRRRDGGYIITGYHHRNVLPLMDRLMNLIHDRSVRHVS